MNRLKTISIGKLNALIHIKAATFIAMLFILLIAGALWVQTLELPYPSDVFPKLVFASVGVLAVLIMLTTVVDKSEHFNLTSELGRSQYYLILASLIATILYIVLTEFLGFYTATLLFLCTMFIGPLSAEKRLNYRHLTREIIFRLAVAVIITAAIYACFRILLQVPTAKGILI